MASLHVLRLEMIIGLWYLSFIPGVKSAPLCRSQYSSRARKLATLATLHRHAASPATARQLLCFSLVFRNCGIGWHAGVRTRHTTGLLFGRGGSGLPYTRVLVPTPPRTAKPHPAPIHPARPRHAPPRPALALHGASLVVVPPRHAP